MRARTLIGVLLAAAVSAAAPAGAEKLAGCGGDAPLQRLCRTSFIASEGEMEISFRWYGHYAGRLEGRLIGPTGSSSLECVVIDVVGPFVFSCRAGRTDGVFIPGQELSLRGDAHGSGTWEVFVTTTSSQGATKVTP